MIFTVTFAALGLILLLAYCYQFHVERCMTTRSSDLQHWALRLAIPSLACWVCSLVLKTIITDVLAGDAPALEVACDSMYNCSTLGGYGMVFFIVLNAIKNSWLVADLGSAASGRVELLQSLLFGYWIVLWCLGIGTLVARVVANRDSYAWIFLAALALSLVITMGGAWVSLLQMRARLIDMAQQSSTVATGDSILDRLTPFYRFMGIATVLLAAAAAFQALGAATRISSDEAYHGRAWEDFDQFNPITLIAWSIVLFYSWRNKPSTDDVRPIDRTRTGTVMRKSVLSAASVVPADETIGVVAGADAQSGAD